MSWEYEGPLAREGRQTLDAFLPGERFVQLGEAGDHPVDAELGLDPGSPRFAQCRAQGRVGHDPADRLRQGRGVLERDEQAGDVGWTTSVVPGAAVATTGLRNRIASRTTLGIPS